MSANDVVRESILENVNFFRLRYQTDYYIVIIYSTDNWKIFARSPTVR